MEESDSGPSHDPWPSATARLFRLLMRRYPDRVPAGELAEALALKASTLSAYLSALMQAGLVTQERPGTSLRYCIAMAEVRRTFDYLLLDCCRGRRTLLARLFVQPPQGTCPCPSRKYTVLFICTGNSARSIFAESILRKQAGDRFDAFSAGTRRARNSTRSRSTCWAEGHDISVFAPRTFRSSRSGRAAFRFRLHGLRPGRERGVPAWPGQPGQRHWGMPDPVKVEGTDAQKASRFIRPTVP